MKYYFVSYRFGDHGYGNIEVECEKGIRSCDDLDEIRKQIKTAFPKITNKVIITNFIQLKYKSKEFRK